MTAEFIPPRGPEPARPGWGLPHPLFAAAFPFHLLLDRQLRIRQAGPSLLRLEPHIRHDALLASHFTITTPRSASTFDTIAARSRSMFLLSSVTNPSVTLRGQMLHDDVEQLLFFVGSPWVTDTAALASLGLTLDDFAVSDAVIDYVLLLQQQANSLAISRELAARLQRTTDELTYQAFHDGLTGLPNRAMFNARVQAAAQPGHGPACEHLSVIMLDLDDFQAVNDSFGHPTGDELLRVVAKRLRHLTRPQDTVARLGGDEFAILVEAGHDCGSDGPTAATHLALTAADLQRPEPPTVGRCAAAEIADRVMAALREPISLPPPACMTIQIAASIGIASCAGATTADELLRNADLAMYVAKSTGKDRQQQFHPGMHTAALARIELAAALRAAVVADELILHYQPIIDTRTGRICAVEALLRWPHPQRGFVSPEEFIPLAESIGLIGEVGTWVLRTACAQVSRWQGLALAVNVSPLQLGPALRTQVRSALADTGLHPGRLTLEITETLLAEDNPQVLSCLQNLVADGIHLSVDDFGTGHSSLSRLLKYPIHELKIDKSFVIGLADGDTHTGLVAGVVALAHGIGLEVVAEGVESSEDYCILTTFGCERAQGYHLGRPVPPQDIDAILRLEPAQVTI